MSLKKMFDDVLDNNAKKRMKQWDLNKFKRVFPRLYATIIDSMNEIHIKNQKTH